jgi:hypothetical protein
MTNSEKDASMICENLNMGLLRQFNIPGGISKELRHGKKVKDSGRTNWQ